ncbi:MAG: ABC transporter permease [Deltaproteobacteria bacterium]|nr:ABC transporter permease [Deltaproteobacteria bacterium]
MRLVRHLAGRVAAALATLLAVSFLAFAVFFLVPSNPAVRLAGKNATTEDIRRVARRYGLDRPWWEQYGRFVARMARGDLGESFLSQEPVTKSIVAALPPTMALTAGAALLWTLAGVPLGIVMASRKRGASALGALSLVGVSTPPFWLALLFLWLFADQMGLFPLGGYRTIAEGGPGGWARSLALPWLTLALLYAGWYARMTRAGLNDALSADYSRTARAKGASPRRVLFRHALRNALLPIVTMFGMDVGGLLGGAVLTESVYGIPGLGGLAWRAIAERDLPLVMGTVLVAAAFLVVANMLVDLAYAVLDPRVGT